MKRSLEGTSDGDMSKRKVALVERDREPGGIALVNSSRTSTKTFAELMELEEELSKADSFLQANTRNKLEVIGKQMKNLKGAMNDVINEAKLCHELNNTACNFVKKPGHVYHLYEKPSGQRYIGMLSPEEWINSPHHFLGSFHLEADHSWTPIGQEESRNEGINFLRDVFLQQPGMKALLGSNS